MSTTPQVAIWADSFQRQNIFISQSYTCLLKWRISAFLIEKKNGLCNFVFQIFQSLINLTYSSFISLSSDNWPYQLEGQHRCISSCSKPVHLHCDRTAQDRPPAGQMQLHNSAQDQSCLLLKRWSVHSSNLVVLIVHHCALHENSTALRNQIGGQFSKQTIPNDQMAVCFDEVNSA